MQVGCFLTTHYSCFNACAIICYLSCRCSCGCAGGGHQQTQWCPSTPHAALAQPFPSLLAPATFLVT